MALTFSSPLLTISLSLSFHSSLQTDAQTSGTFPLNSAKRSKEVTIDESANATAPSASDDLEFAEEGNAVFMLTCQLLNMSLYQSPAQIVTNNELLFIKLPLFNGETIICIKAHTDSCAALSVGSLRVRQFIMHTHPDVVYEYIQFDNPASFEPICLSVAMTSDKPVDLTSKEH